MPNEKSITLNQPEQCCKFESCSATLCPLDLHRAKRLMHRDDPCCFFLLEVAKPGGKELISMGYSEEMYQIASTVFLEVVDMAYPIKRSLLRAANTPSRIHSVGKEAAQMGLVI